VSPSTPPPPSTKRIMGIVFADVVGFGSMTETEVHAFARHLLPECIELAKTKKTAYCNTWGDAIVAYFDSLGDALDYSLALRDIFRNRNWRASAEDVYSRPLAVRIALHAADVFVTEADAVPGGKIFGTQVSLAARIEPIATPNEVFASEAAVAGLRRDDIVSKNLGVVTLPKEHKKEKIFWIRRVGDSSRRDGIAIAAGSLRTLGSTEEAIAEIAAGGRIHSLKVLTLNGGSSLHSLLDVAQRRLAAKARVSISVFDPQVERLQPPKVLDDPRQDGYVHKLRTRAMKAPAASRSACEYLMQASELTAWSNESQEAQTTRLRERLSLCLREVTARQVRAVLLQSPRWVPARCWLIDDYAYVMSHWQPNVLAPILVAEKPHPLYEAVRRHFEYVWDEAVEMPDAVLLDAESTGRARR
jgi:class 3 adenylate cyclase